MRHRITSNYSSRSITEKVGLWVALEGQVGADQRNKRGVSFLREKRALAEVAWSGDVVRAQRTWWSGERRVRLFSPRKAFLLGIDKRPDKKFRHSFTGAPVQKGGSENK